MARRASVRLLGWLLVAVVGCSSQPPPKPTPADSLPAPSARQKGTTTQPAQDEPGDKGDLIIPPPPPAAKSAKGQASDHRPTAPAGVGLRIVGLDEFQKYIAGLKGKIVAVDAWATYCIPCVEKFPKYVSLATGLARDDIVFVTLSGDDENKIEKAEQFLAGAGAERLVNFLVTNDLSETQEAFQFEGLPRYFIFGRDGKVLTNTDIFEEFAKRLTDVIKKRLDPAAGPCLSAADSTQPGGRAAGERASKP